MKGSLKLVWVIPMVALLLTFLPDDSAAAGKKCCVAKEGSVICQKSQADHGQISSTIARKQPAACAETCCGKASEPCCSKDCCKAGCNKCGETCGKSCCGQHGASSCCGR